MDSGFKDFFKHHPDWTLYPESFIACETCTIAMAKTPEGDRLLVAGSSAILNSFAGEMRGTIKCCLLTHYNRLAVNRFFPFTCPRAAGRDRISFGLGDRLGVANYAHLLALKGKSVFPILAQQSKRELNLTNRSYEDVLDAAVWAVVKAGWRSGFGADGDHLKTEEDIAHVLRCGYSMITLDCSDVIQQVPKDPIQLKAAYEALPADERQRLETSYLYSTDADRKRLGIFYTLESLMQIAVCFYPCIEFAKRVYFSQISRVDRQVDFELSLDETADKTLPAAHFLVANELANAGVVITSMAPRFAGEFQKAVDYIGDLAEFRLDFDYHCTIADYFGYKISVHSGSDKFAVFPIIGARAAKRLHLKTSGTSWLEAVHVVALFDPVLYRDMHRNALVHLADARCYYAVHAGTDAIRPLEELTDEQLPEYLNENDARQLLHITYGYQLADPDIRARFFAVLDNQYSDYIRILGNHIKKHVDLLQSGTQG